MTQREKIKFRITDIEPNPKEVDWWIDLSTDEYGGCMRYYREDTLSWELFNLNDQHLNQLVEYLNKEMEELGSSTLETIESTKAELLTQIELIQELISSLLALQASTISNSQQLSDLRSIIDSLAATIDKLNAAIEDLTDHSITYAPVTAEELAAIAQSFTANEVPVQPDMNTTFNTENTES